MAKLEETTPAQARKRCAGALVGTGTGKALVTLPGQAPFTDHLADLHLQRAAERRQADADRPRLRDGALAAGAAGAVHDRKGRTTAATATRPKIELPPIAGGYGAATLAEAQFGAHLRSAAAGRSATPKPNAPAAGCRSTANLIFTDGSLLQSPLTSPCHFAG